MFPCLWEKKQLKGRQGESRDGGEAEWDEG